MATKVMVSFPEDFLKEIDRIAAEEQRSRSELLREAMRLYIAARARARPPGEDPVVQAAVRVQDALARISPGAGEDSAAELRRWRESHHGAS